MKESIHGFKFRAMKGKKVVLYVVAGLMWVVPCAVAQDMVDLGQPSECSLQSETYPRFPGGEKACAEYVAAHLVYPEMAKKNGVTGRIMLQFNVMEDGSLQDVKVLKSKLKMKAAQGGTDATSGASAQVSLEEEARRKALKEECGRLMEEEALRIVRSMPKWEPGTLNGKVVKVKCVLPVKFTL